MPTAAPKSKANEIIEELSRLSFDDDNLRFALMRCKREAKAVLDAQPEAYWSIMGAVACLEKNFKEMHSCHLNSIKISPASYYSIALMNYASSLSRVGLYFESYEWTLKAFKHDSADIKALTHLIEKSIWVGRILEAFEYLKRCTLDEKCYSRAKDLVFLANILKQNRIDDILISNNVKSVIDILNMESSCNWDFGWWLSDKNEHTGIVTYIYVIDDPAVEIMSLKEKVDSCLKNVDGLKGLVTFEIFRREVAQFISDNPSCLSVLQSAKKELKNYFPESLIKLELEVDPEITGKSQLVTYVQTALDPEEAIDKLDRFACDWWLEAKNESEGKIAVDLEFV